jgi:hypothetical protein
MQAWKQLLGRTGLGLVVSFVLLYAGDWIVLRYRMAHGTAYGSVEVDQFLATPLKGSKMEYDMVGSFQQTCARSIFPHGGTPPCWWVRRHNSQWE